MQHVQRNPVTSFDLANQLFKGHLFNGPLLNGPFLNGRNGRTENSSDAAPVNKSWAPAVDISEQDNQFTLIADVPGFTASNIDITVDKRVLTVTGTREQAVESSEKGLQRTERYSGDFERRFTLPESVDQDNISAKVEHGVLTITILKSTEAAVRKITVQG